MNKRSSALLQSISEAQEAEKVKSSQEAQQADGDEMNQTPSPIPASPSRAKKQRKKKENLVKLSCYLRPDQVEVWDDLTDELRIRMKKKKLEYKDIDRQVILREIFDTINQEQIEQLLTAKRSSSRNVELFDR